jgi:peptidoglycan hydrolase CwlO-like protein
MQELVEMAKAHLQNVNLKVRELESQKQLIQSEIDKLVAYLNDGMEKVNRYEQHVAEAKNNV